VPVAPSSEVTRYCQLSLCTVTRRSRWALPEGDGRNGVGGSWQRASASRRRGVAVPAWWLVSRANWPAACVRPAGCWLGAGLRAAAAYVWFVREQLLFECGTLDARGEPSVLAFAVVASPGRTTRVADVLRSDRFVAASPRDDPREPRRVGTVRARLSGCGIKFAAFSASLRKPSIRAASIVVTRSFDSVSGSS